MATKEELTTEATAEIEAQKPMYGLNSETGRYELSDADYAQAITDLANSKWNAQQFGYIQSRLEAYGGIGDQLDLLFHDMTADKGDKTGEWFKAVKAVKDATAKPS